MGNGLIKTKQVDGLEPRLEALEDLVITTGDQTIDGNKIFNDQVFISQWFTSIESSDFSFGENQIYLFSGSITGTLGTPITGRKYLVKNIHPSATGVITASQQIDGTGSLELYPKESFELFGDGVTWRIG